MTIFTQTGVGQARQENAQNRAHVGTQGHREGLEAAHAHAVWRAGAMGGGSTASFRCRRIFRMTLPCVIAAITQGSVIRKILRHLKLAVDPPPIAPARQTAFA